MPYWKHLSTSKFYGIMNLAETRSLKMNGYVQGVTLQHFSQGELAGYPRKSTATENAGKSIDDQISVIFEVAERYNLPLTSEDLFIEDVGHGGDEWWAGGGKSGLANDTQITERTRPKLTELLNLCITGAKKGIIIYDQDRLWRDVGICDAMIDLLNKYGVMLFDRYGPVDIATPQGKQMVRSNAVSSANYRERSAEDSRRGIVKNREQGKLVTGCDVLGFRSGGRYSRTVIHIPDEQEMVRRIFRMFDVGEDGQGPMSYATIARKLMEEGYQWTPDLHEKRGKQRTGHTKNLIYDWQIKRLLTDCRYQARQPHGGEEWACDILLVDGMPVVDVALYERVQAKIKAQSRVSNAGVGSRALTSMVRCGLCGQGLNVSPTTTNYGDGRVERIPYWKNVRREAWCWCTHKLPHLREDVLDDYVNAVFAPLILADMRERTTGTNSAELQSRRATLQRQLGEMEKHFEEEVRELRREGASAKTIALFERDHLQSTAIVAAQIRETEQTLNSFQGMEASLEDLGNLPPSARRDTLRGILRWLAVLPSTAPRERVYGNFTRLPKDAGTLVFLTAFGTYHTAKIDREFTGKTDHRQRVLRAALPGEMVGSVADFPDPATFLAGLKRGFDGKKYPFDPYELAPGYLAGQTQDIAHFEISDAE